MYFQYRVLEIVPESGGENRSAGQKFDRSSRENVLPLHNSMSNTFSLTDQSPFPEGVSLCHGVPNTLVVHLSHCSKRALTSVPL